MSFYITTDSGSDISKKYLEKFKVTDTSIIPITYTVDGVLYDIANNDMGIKEFYSKMRNNSKLSTSLINTFTAEEFFRPLLKEGHDILHICFSSGLSGTYKCVKTAFKNLKIEFPERKIAVVDALNASLGQGLIYHYTLEKRRNGGTFEECEEYARYLADHVNSYLLVDDLKHLMRTGRATKAETFIGTTLQIKPILYMSHEGKLIPVDKAISKRKAIKVIVNRLKKVITTYDENTMIFISHADDEEGAKATMQLLQETTPLKNFFIDYISPTIGSHSGPGTISLFFIGKDKKDSKDNK